MAIRDLQERYGGACASQTINRAVMAEVPGGKRAFDLRREVYLTRGSSRKMAFVYEQLNAVCEEMREFIAQKYDLQSARKEKEGANDERSGMEAR